MEIKRGYKVKSNHKTDKNSPLKNYIVTDKDQEDSTPNIRHYVMDDVSPSSTGHIFQNENEHEHY